MDYGDHNVLPLLERGMAFLSQQPLDAKRLDEELDEYSRAILVARAEAGRARRQARRRASSRLASAAPRFQCRLF